MKYSKSEKIHRWVKILIMEHQCIFKKGKKHNRIISKQTNLSVTFSTTPSDKNAHWEFRRHVKQSFNIVL